MRSETDSAEIELAHLIHDWDARHYLDYYYGNATVPDDEAAMFRFIARGLRDIGRQFETGLELGCGPVLHHAAQAVPWVTRLDMADVQEANLEEIRRWIRRNPGAFDWSVLIGGKNGVLDAEEGRGGSLAEREALMRSRLNPVRCDLRESLPLGVSVQYPFVTSYYCAEWVIPTLAGWQETMRTMTSTVAPGGYLLLGGVHATDYCMLNGRRLPCARITEVEVRGALDHLGFDPSTIRLEITPALTPSSGIHEVFSVFARRSG